MSENKVTQENFEEAKTEEEVQQELLPEVTEKKTPQPEPEIAADRIDLNALWVVRRLRAKGYEAYLTGGCVRDLLLGKEPKDFDVATSAKPEEVKSIFRNCRLIGRRFLLAHVVFPGGKIIETATFRRKPSEEEPEEEQTDLLVSDDNVYGSMEEDAFRRDLTINGLFYDPVAGKVIDYVGGREDLEKKLIRSIGDPEVRLPEDPVRIVRAIRFAKRLGFDIEENTFTAMKNVAPDMVRCAPARLQEELIRLLTSGHAKESLSCALDIGLLEVLMPELLEGLGLTQLELGGESYEPLAEQEKEKIISYWFSLLDALDQVHERDCDIAPAVAFTALLLPAYQRLEDSGLNERNWIDRLCVSWAERLRLTRKDQDLLRILLSAIPLFSLDKIHQKSAQYLVRKPWFRESLLAYTLHLIATKESLEKIKIWKLLARDADRSYRQDRRSLRADRTRFRKRRPPFRSGQRRFRRPNSQSQQA